MPVETNVVKNAQTVEYGKFVELKNDSRFPAVSVTRFQYPDQSNAFPGNQGVAPNQVVDVYPKYAVLTYDVSTGQSNGSPFGDNSSSDAFGRLRVSQQDTLLDSKNIYSKNNLLFDEVLSGTATANFSAYDSCVDLRTTANGDYAIRQTRVRFNYQPGKGMQFMFTGVFAPEANITKRVGAFQSLTAAPYEPSDGIFMEVTSSGPAFRVVKTQGTPHTHYAPQSAWNVDRLDGTGPSGITIDFTKAVLFVIDYEWLSIGRIRYGFYVNGKCYYAHYNGHMGELTGPYMTFSNQPVRYEIRQTGVGSGLLRQICSTCMIEGGQENIGKAFNVVGNAVTVQEDVYTPVLALRENPATPNLNNIIREVSVINSGTPGNPIHYSVFLNPLMTGGTLNFSPVANTIMLSAAGNGSISVTQGVSGYSLFGAFCASGQGAQAAPAGGDAIAGSLARFGTGVRGDPDTFVLAAKGFGGTATVYGSFNLLEKG